MGVAAIEYSNRERTLICIEYTLAMFPARVFLFALCVFSAVHCDHAFAEAHDQHTEAEATQEDYVKAAPPQVVDEGNAPSQHEWKAKAERYKKEAEQYKRAYSKAAQTERAYSELSKLKSFQRHKGEYTHELSRAKVKMCPGMTAVQSMEGACGDEEATTGRSKQQLNT